MKPSRPYLYKITAQLNWRGTASCTKKVRLSVQGLFEPGKVHRDFPPGASMDHAWISRVWTFGSRSRLRETQFSPDRSIL